MTIEEKVYYTLRNKETKEIITYTKESTGSSYCCGEYQYRLDYKTASSELWLLESAKDVYYVLHNSTPWYNADSIEYPSHNLDPEEWEVVEYKKQVTISTYKDEVLDKISEKTVESFCKEEYSKPEYHCNTEDIKEMIYSYNCGDMSMCRHNTFEKFVKYLGKLED